MPELTIHFEHPDFFIVEKPAGSNFHDEGEIEQGFFNQCQRSLGQNLFPVHRLDKVTSGLVILARNNKAAVWFQQAFEMGKINKFYLAIAKGKPKKKQGAIVGDMTPSRRSQWKLLKTNANPAISQFFSYALESSEKGLRLFLVKPHTGKTHQIRVALKSLGTPILGDELYGGLATDRGYLHASRLAFNYNGDAIDVISVPLNGQLFSEAKEQTTAVLSQATELKWPTLKIKASDKNE